MKSGVGGEIDGGHANLLEVDCVACGKPPLPRRKKEKKRGKKKKKKYQLFSSSNSRI